MEEADSVVRADRVVQADCVICAKQRGEGDLVGALIFEDELISISHRPASQGPPGYVFLETRRHVGYVDQLTEDEAKALGWARTRIGAALRAELDPAFVFSVVSGMGVPHFHEHVRVRHRGTPDDVAWHEQWAGAPTGDVDALATNLARRFDGTTYGDG